MRSVSCMTLVLFLIVTVYNDVMGQQVSIDSILQQLEKPFIQDTTQVISLCNLSHLYEKLDPEVGLKYGQKALKLAEKINYQRGQAIGLTAIGENLAQVYDYSAALGNFLVALAIFEKMGSNIDKAKILTLISAAYCADDKYDNSIKYAHQSLVICKDLESTEIVVSNLTQIGEANFRMSNHGEAFQYFTQALRLSMRIGDQKGQALNQFHLGQVHTALGNYDSARHYATQTLELNEKLGDKHGTATALAIMGNIYFEQGHFAKAMNNYIEAKDINIEINDKRALTYSLLSIGIIYYRLTNLSKALEYFDSAHLITKRNHLFLYQAYIMEDKGLAYFAQGNYAEALKHYLASRAFYSKTKNASREACVLASSARVHIELEEYDQASDYLKRSLTILYRLDEQVEIARTNYVLATMFYKMSQFDSAIHYGKKALQTSDSLHLLPLVSDVTKVLYKALFKKKKFEKGQIFLDQHMEVKDSIFNIEKAMAIRSREFESELDAKTKENNRLIQESQLKGVELEYRQSIIVSMFVFFLLSVGLTLLLYRLFTIKKRTVVKVKTSHALIEKQKEEIKSINTNLENLVQQRTAKIKRQNDRFVKFAFHNAHIVRGPLARLLGLLNLFANDMLEEKEKKEYLTAMIVTAQELDNVVSKINNILTNGLERQMGKRSQSTINESGQTLQSNK